MLKSLNRLVRHLVGAPPLPASEAMMGGADAERLAQDAARARENLKRAMEAAFAAPSDAEPPPLEEAARPLAAQEWTIVMIDADAPAPAEHMSTKVVLAAFGEHEAGAHSEGFITAQVEPIEPAADEVVEEAAPAETPEEPAQAAEDVIELDPAVAEAPEDLATAEVATEAHAPVAEAAVAEVESEGPIAEDVAPDAEPTEEVATESPIDEVAAEAASAQTPVEEAEEIVAKPQRAKKAAAKKKKAPAKKKATKKAAAPKAGAALPEDAVWVSDAVTYSLNGEWVQTWYPPEDGAGFERLKELCAKAGEGALTLWGRVDGTQRWEPVKAAFWKTGFIEPLSFVMGRENLETDAKTASRKPKKAQKYHGLKVSRAEVEALWPAAQPEVRNAA